jgi:hypothetical protein
VHCRGVVLTYHCACLANVGFSNQEREEDLMPEVEAVGAVGAIAHLRLKTDTLEEGAGESRGWPRVLSYLGYSREHSAGCPGF